jgi:thiol-disulfide isomerase/thioredoxin
MFKYFMLLLSFFVSISVGSVQAANHFVLKDMTGKIHSLDQYAGKWVFVNYWATWCPPCLEEVPDLVALYDSRKNKDLVVIGVVFDYENVKEVTDYVNDMLMSYPIVLGDDDVASQIGEPGVLPTTYIFNPQGVLVKTKHGKVTKQYLESLIAGDSIKKK